MDAEQKKFLQARLRKAVVEQPRLRDLKNLLLGLGGEFLVPPVNADSDLPALLEFGFLMSGPVKLKRMGSRMCHANVASLWQNKKADIIAVGTGYALSDDGLWRQHSWGLLRDGVLETTQKRTRYFGILLRGTEADYFVFNNTS